MSARRILFLNHVGVAAGAEHSLLALVRALERGRYEPYAVCPQGPLATLLAGAGAQVRQFPLRRLHRARSPFRLLGDALRTYAVARRIAREWKEPPIDLIHSNSTTAHLYGAMLARRWGVPCVWHVRDLVPLGALGRWLYRRTDAVVAISNAVADCVRGAVSDSRKVHVIPNGICVELPAVSVANAPLGAGLEGPESAPLVAVVGQLVPWKRHDVFLRAFASVVKKLPEAMALIVGDDLFGDNRTYKSEIRNLAHQLNLESRVRFLGWREDVPAILNACDLLVVPSQAEPFGRVALEAMLAGKPVVGTRAGGLPDIVLEGETGWLVPPGEPVAMAEAIVRALSDRERARQMGEAGKERVQKLFDIRLTARSVEKLYETLLSSRGTGG